MKPWVKFYTETLHDRKIRKLSERDQLVFFKLVLLAGQEDMNGALPSIEDISLELYLDETDVSISLQHLLKAGLVYENENGVTIVTNFEKRQNTNLTPAEKQQRYRDKQKNISNPSNNEVTIVTELSNKSTKKVTVDKDKDKEKEIEKEEELINADSHECEPPQISKNAKQTSLSMQDVSIRNSISGKTDVKAKNPSSSVKEVKTPDMPEYWTVFKHKAELAKTFYEVSGIAPLKNEFGRWQKDLDQFIEAGITVEALEQAIRKIQSEGKITIKAPGSVFSTARSILAQVRNQPSQTKQVEPDRWDMAAMKVKAQLSEMTDDYPFLVGVIGEQETSGNVIDI